MEKADIVAQLRKQIESFSAQEAVITDEPERAENEAFGNAAVQIKLPKEKRDAFTKIIDLVNASDKSEKAIRERLSRYEFDRQEIDQAVARAKSYGFIDDMRYADLLVRSRISQGKGSAGIERELEAQGIDPLLLEGWPTSYGIEYDTELERALDMLKRKPPRSKNMREGAYRKLMQKGYPSSVASSAARIWAESFVE